MISSTKRGFIICAVNFAIVFTTILPCWGFMVLGLWLFRFMVFCHFTMRRSDHLCCCALLKWGEIFYTLHRFPSPACAPQLRWDELHSCLCCSPEERSLIITFRNLGIGNYPDSRLDVARGSFIPDVLFR